MSFTFVKKFFQKLQFIILVSFEIIKWVIDVGLQRKMIKCYFSDKFNFLSSLIIFSTIILLLDGILWIILYLISTFDSSFALLMGYPCTFFWIFVGPWGILACVVIYFVEKYYKKSEEISIQKGQYLSNEPHHAIIFVKYENFQNKLFTADCIHLLVTAFDNKIPFKIYPINSEADFNAAYTNPNVRWLWIIGHGEKGALAYSQNNEMKWIEYSNYQPNLNLQFIAQLNCNHGVGPSLLEINDLKPDYDMDHIRLNFQNRCYITKKTNEFLENTSKQFHKYSSDIPLKNPNDDRLGYRKIARSIATGIIDITEPHGYVISINAKWGSGKTSFLNFIEFYLKNNDRMGGLIGNNENAPIIITFNPWWFTGKEDLFRQFFGQFGLGLSKELKSIVTITRLLGQYLVAISKVNIPYDATMDVIEASFNPEKMDVLSLKQKIINELPKNRKIVFIIDDIDRLSGDEVKQLFQVIKKVADFPNVIYILAFDRDIVEPMLKSVQESSGSKYLEKIVQAPFNLPIPTKYALNLILCEKIKEILGDYPKQIWDKAHWFNVYNGGICELIDTPRNIVRLTNTIRVTYPPIKNEVNPIDFIALETIRIFQPDCYERIQKNENFFYGYVTKIWDHERLELNAYHTSWINEMIPSQKKPVEKIIKAMFPVVASVMESSNLIDCHDYHKLRRELRICCPEFFSRYYWMTVPQESISADEFEIIKLAFSDRHQFRSLLLKVVNDSEFGLIKFDFLMQKIIDYSQDVPKEAIVEIINAIYDVYDEIISIDSDRNGRSGVLNYYRRSWLLKLLLSRLEVDERLGIFTQIIDSSKSLFSISWDTYSILKDPSQNKCEYLTFNLEACSQNLFNLDTVEEIKKKIVNKIKKTAASGDLEKTNHLMNVLEIWREWDTRPNAQKWVQDQVKTDSGLLNILENFSFIYVGAIQGIRINRLEFNFDALNKYIEFSELKKKIFGSIESLKKIPNLSSQQHEIVEKLSDMISRETSASAKIMEDIEPPSE